MRTRSSMRKELLKTHSMAKNVSSYFLPSGSIVFSTMLLRKLPMMSAATKACDFGCE